MDIVQVDAFQTILVLHVTRHVHQTVHKMEVNLYVPLKQDSACLAAAKDL